MWNPVLGLCCPVQVGVLLESYSDEVFLGEDRTLLSLCARFTVCQGRTPRQSISEARLRGSIALWSKRKGRLV